MGKRAVLDRDSRIAIGFDWVFEAACGTRAAIGSAYPSRRFAEMDAYAVAAFLKSPLHSAFVKTIIIDRSATMVDSFFQREELGLRSSVKEWGVDGLLFNSRDLILDYAAHIVESLASIPSCTTLCVCTDGFEGFHFEALCRAISCLPNLTHLYLNSRTDAGTCNLQMLGEALLESGTNSLQSLSIESSFCSETSLMPLLTSNTCSLKSLSVISYYSNDYVLTQIILNICIRLTQNNLTLRSLSLIMLVSSGCFSNLSWRKLGNMLVHNTSLTSFTLHNFSLPEAAVRCLFTSLEDNRHLTSLSLAYCTSEAGATPNWPYASVLDSLRVNTTLHELDVTGTPLENDNAIKAQVLRNKAEAARVEVLKRRHSVLVRPTTVRLFICGLQYSGKTTLSRSLTNWNQNTSWFSRMISTSRLKRTRGIEVTMLEKEVGDQHLRISLWDMAGHIEFHSFLDSMFPDLSSGATPSMFLFVWNPYEIDDSGNIQLDSQGQKTRKEVHKFRDEFKYWLRFIASKTLKSEIFKPKVLVAVSRADLGFKDMKLWLKSDFTALQEEFQELIQFDEGFFYLNAKDYLQVGQLGSHVFDCAKAILKQVPDVHQACVEARELFGNMVHDDKVPPLITKSQFHQLCHEELHMDSQEMREAVALSLSDSGDLIYFKSLELVVLDTQWFCHKIMGNLLNDIMTKESLDRSGNRDVFFPLLALEALLERIVNSRTSKLVKIRRASRTVKSMKVAGCDLVKLLVGLRLACLEDTTQNNSRIFISVRLTWKGKRTLSPSNWLISDGDQSISTYLGRRLTCKNFNCTFLTPGLFPLLQVTFYKILHYPERDQKVFLEEDVIAFAFDGVKVFIEFCRLEGKDHFIDILVYSSKSLDDTIDWLQRNVILDVEKVCVEPRGNQGVELAHSIIQRACIEKFLDARKRPSVSVKKLQDILKDHVERKGVELTDDGIKNAMYTWQTAPFPASSVVDLLGELETAKVVQTYWCSLRDAEREISELFVEEAKTSQPQELFEFGRSQTRKEREIILNKGEMIIYNKLCEVEKNVIREFQKLEHAVQDLRNAVLPKLCELFTFVKEGEAGKSPRMFVVTKDEGIVRRVVSAMVHGLQNVRLELLCECRSEPCHRVDGKLGLSLATLDDGLLKRGLPYINALLKVAYVVARVGAHVAVGFGDSIPDFTRVLANIVDAPNCDVLPDFTDLTDDWNSSSRIDFQKGQQWLFDVLSNHDCIKGDQIYAVFGLRRVRFHDSRAAWVCDKHYPEGAPWPA